MMRLSAVGVGIGLLGWGGSLALAQPAQMASPQGATNQAGTRSITSSGQTYTLRTPHPLEVTLMQALRANPATAPYPFSTVPRGSKILLQGRVGAKIVHDVAIRTAINLGVPVEDGITIDTGFNPGLAPGGAYGGGFGPVPGPGPNTTGNVGFGGPPAFGNSNVGPGGGAGYGAGYAGGAGGGGIPPVLGFPSAGSYGGAPSLLPPPIFGRYDDPFYGFDPPAVIYPPWWGALNAQRVGSNAAFNNAGVNGNLGNVAGVQPQANMGGAGAYQGQAMAGQGMAQADPTAMINPGGATDPNVTNTDIGAIPDGTVDMEIDNNGVATIRGGIPSQAEKDAVGQRIAGMTGVSQVVNLLTIKPSLMQRNVITTAGTGKNDNTPPFPTPVEATPAQSATPAPPTIISTPANPTPIQRPTPTLKPNSNPTPINPGAAIDTTGDTGLTDRATRVLADRAATIGSTVRVKVRDGVAQVSGKVASVYEAMLAYRAIQQVPGVRSIDDRLEFPVPDGSNGSNPLIDKGRPDDVEPYLEAQIRRQVGDIAHIDRVRIQADALDVRGTLARDEDRDRFDAILRSMAILRGFKVNADLPVATP